MSQEVRPLPSVAEKRRHIDVPSLEPPIRLFLTLTLAVPIFGAEILVVYLLLTSIHFPVPLYLPTLLLCALIVGTPFETTAVVVFFNDRKLRKSNEVLKADATEARDNLKRTKSAADAEIAKLRADYVDTLGKLEEMTQKYDLGRRDFESAQSQLAYLRPLADLATSFDNAYQSIIKSNAQPPPKISESAQKTEATA